MKQVAVRIGVGLALGLGLGLGTTQPLWSQANDIPSAAPVMPAGQTPEQHGRKVLDEMVEALGGDAWLHRRNMRELGHIGRFFRGTPTGVVIDFTSTRQFATADRFEALRVGFITDKSILLPGKKIDIVQIWTAGKGYEVTYKGRVELPKDQVEDFYRRRDHSVEAVVNTWLKAPGVVVVYEGTSMVERRLAEKVTILNDNNDAVTLDLDVTTHLPLRRTFEWRNETFKDLDEDAEEYADYHTIQGLPTAFTISRYHNGDLTSQTFLLKVEYDVDAAPDMFNPDVLLKKKQ
ncbi:hypothetical protein [Tunturiibacter gelidoferens]|uniref:Outer membrane lipoprotein-sorting protein n=1 Tax=Tunturiibacter lichenicola TaxID=2051959 RepID=A0A7Y9NJ30_9BACT|nr:hypothetical protein [Edaphobacter lichenicola]NYF49733.1 hypothetical protein [Edaphobacter lichenicola]